MTRFIPSLYISRIDAAPLLLLRVVAGYLAAGWWSGSRDTTPLARICGRVNYISGLQTVRRGHWRRGAGTVEGAR
jgi:hypothetical protein